MPGLLVVSARTSPHDFRGGSEHRGGAPCRMLELLANSHPPRNEQRRPHRAQPLQIRVEARALDRGGSGERIRAMNLDSRNAVVGRVVGPGVVEVSR